ncbi:Arginase/deacetylase [Lactarius akahatsu]|uniref:Arginase/deacetylase n=1 Tax=Lactarius akahatsu TaxID=416441 RepID=A0AAD4LHA0_9AGAM|nr:Arginase/deacetylase [Lactarius akahatsu]
MKVFWDPICLLHDPPYEILSGDKVPYFESPARLQVIKKELEEHPSLFQLELTDSSSGSIDIIGNVETVHGRGYLNYLRNAYDEWVRDGGSVDAVLPNTFPHQKLVPRLSQSHVDSLSPVAKAGYYCFDLSSPITKVTYSSVIASVNVALSAARELAITSGSCRPKVGVFALCRPPGHHAGTSLSGGYCFVNNVAVAARFLQGFNQRPTDKPSVAILDVDYHHGNGTQEIFYSDPSVRYVSLHAEDDYPYFTGSTTEKGIDDGVGANINYPLPRGTQDSEYCAVLSNAVEDIKKFDPGYLLLSLGVDTFVDDPISDFKLSPSCYTHIGRVVADMGKPTLFVMEGGYHLETIGKNVRAVLQGFEEQG